MNRSSLYYARLPKIPLKKRFKALEWLVRSKGLFSPFPLKAKVEITRRCNLNCRMCLRPHLPTYPDMTSNQFKTVMQQLKGIIVFSPHGYGEPLLHPDFLEFMLHVTSLKIKIHLVTNGTLFFPEIADPFIKFCRPFKIAFSVDGATAKTYQWIRRNAKFDVVLANMAEAVEIKKKYGSNTELVWYCTIAKYNFHEIPLMVHLAQQIGLDRIHFTDLTLHGYGLARKEQAIRKENLDGSVVDTVRQLRRMYGTEIAIGYRVAHPQKTACELPWLATFVQANGDIFPCTDTFSCKLGNIFEVPFKKIWNGQKMRMFRKSFLENPLEECRKCVWYQNEST